MAKTKDCNALTSEKAPCRKRRFPFSRYCWHHQDTSWQIGVILGVLAILISFVIFFYQERRPDLQVTFDPPIDGDASILNCTITNTGRAEARDVYLSFNLSLPLDTKVLASPELGLTIQEADKPPNPALGVFAAKLQKAFAVHIPRVPIRDPIQFQVATTHPDNKREALQMIRVQQEIRGILSDFYQFLFQNNPTDGKKLDYKQVISYQLKDTNFFEPALLSYEQGRATVSVFSEGEKAANAAFGDLRTKYEKEFQSIVDKRQEIRAPIVKLKTIEGEFSFPIMVDLVKNYSDFYVDKEYPNPTPIPPVILPNK